MEFGLWEWSAIEPSEILAGCSIAKVLLLQMTCHQMMNIWSSPAVGSLRSVIVCLDWLIQKYQSNLPFQILSWGEELKKKVLKFKNIYICM